jgi:hypothetical protein
MAKTNQSSTEINNEINKIYISTISNVVATSLVYPFDTVRVRMHLNKVIHYTFKDLYKGYVAGLFRQLTYSTPNIYIYSSLISNYRATCNNEPKFVYKFCYGLISGTIAGIIGTPSEVIMIRSIVSKSSTGIIQNSKNILEKYGASHFLNGCFPTVIRSATFNSIRLSLYSELKPYVSNHNDNTLFTHSISALISTTVGIVVSNPFDVIKSRMQKKNTPFIETYKSIKNESLLQFYRGFIPNMIKSIPHSIISFILFEKMSRQILNKEII